MPSPFLTCVSDGRGRNQYNVYIGIRYSSLIYSHFRARASYDITTVDTPRWRRNITRLFTLLLIKQLMEEREGEGDILYSDCAKTRRSHPF